MNLMKKLFRKNREEEVVSEIKKIEFTIKEIEQQEKNIRRLRESFFESYGYDIDLGRVVVEGDAESFYREYGKVPLGYSLV